MKLRTKLSAAAAACMILAFGMGAPAMASPGQTVEDLTTHTAQDLVDALVGAGITTSNVTHVGSTAAAGLFSGMGASGISEGVVLSSGSASAIVGPNSSDGTSSDLSTAGDADLDAIIAPDTTNDAAVLEFDFVPTTSTLSFSYVFASEEYNEYVGEFNDVFAFLVNGVNCAVVGADPVSVNSINAASHPELYKNNDPSDTAVPYDVAFDGFTTVLSCVAPVNEGVTNHIKLAIADAVDADLDSTVLLVAGSFQAVVPAAPTLPPTGLDGIGAALAGAGVIAVGALVVGAVARRRGVMDQAR